MAEHEGDDSEVGKQHVLAHLLSPDDTRNRDEPEIASNIGIQLQHMGLSTGQFRFYAGFEMHWGV